MLRQHGHEMPEEEFRERDLKWVKGLDEMIQKKVGTENLVRMLKGTVELLASRFDVSSWREIITLIYGKDSPEVTNLRALMDAIDSGGKEQLQSAILGLRKRVCDAQVLSELEKLSRKGKRFESWQEILRYAEMTATSPKGVEKRHNRKVDFNRLSPAIRKYLEENVVAIGKLNPGNAFTLQQPGKDKPGAIICMSQIEKENDGFSGSTSFHELVHVLSFFGDPPKLDSYEEIYAMAFTRIIEGTIGDRSGIARSISKESLNPLYILAGTVAELRLIKLLMERPYITYNEMEEIFQGSFRMVHEGLALYEEHVQDRSLMLEVILSRAVLADVPLMLATHLDFGDIEGVANVATRVFNKEGIETVEDQILYYLATIAYMSANGGLAKRVDQFERYLELIIGNGSKKANDLIQKLINRKIPLGNSESSVQA